MLFIFGLVGVSDALGAGDDGDVQELPRLLSGLPQISSVFERFGCAMQHWCRCICCHGVVGPGLVVTLPCHHML